MVKNSILFVVFGHPVFFYILLYIEVGYVSAQKGQLKLHLIALLILGKVTLNRCQMRTKYRYFSHKET